MDTTSTVPTETDPAPPDDLLRRVEAEYLEMPGLKLTVRQAARLWHFDETMTARLLDTMVDAGVLYRTDGGAYLLLWTR